MEKFDLMPILKLAIKNVFILLLTGIVFAGAVLAYCKFIATPKYSSTGSVLVTNGGIMNDNSAEAGSTLSNTNIIASMNLVGTVGDILNTNGIYKQLALKTDDKYTYKQLRSMVRVERKNENSLFINITFSASDPDEARNLVNEFLALAPAYINDFVPNSEVAISTSDSSEKVFPQTFSFMVIAAVAGMAIAFLILILVYSTNTVIQGEEDFAERFDIQVLGNIPDFERSKSDKYNSYNYGYNYSGRGGGY